MATDASRRLPRICWPFPAAGIRHRPCHASGRQSRLVASARRLSARRSAGGDGAGRCCRRTLHAGCGAGRRRARRAEAAARPGLRASDPARRRAERRGLCGHADLAGRRLAAARPLSTSERCHGEGCRAGGREGFGAVEHLKRYTTLGMATDQGKTSNVNGLAILAAAHRPAIAEAGTTRSGRPTCRSRSAPSPACIAASTSGRRG